ncbi:ExbD/TolR family protein [Leeia sp. TBRC 13508]|uniref:ExbD/TolR family protein n=1 Tax=Leeia speluncae TaxID=2884804 RepID=A0ABS8D6P4_9NEIS|nr:ExbD/TolR family protein [Leeia speluncae]MCB6183870.1 ExbD/TolR family protein [Leeia speluncae]
MAASSRRARRALKSEINVVPFIDVVLVLLIVFMVAAPMMQTGQIKLPEAGQSSQVDVRPMQIQIKDDGADTLSLNDGQGNVSTLSIDELVEAIRAKQVENPALPVVISADKTIKYEAVINVMSRLQKDGIKQVGLLVQQQGGK